METLGSGVSRSEGAASLAAVKDSHARARRADYPARYWLASGAAMAAVSVLIFVPLPGPWFPILSMGIVLLGAVMVRAITTVRRLRSPRTLSAAWWELWPCAAVIPVWVAAGVLSHLSEFWSDPLSGLITAGVTFIVFAVAGLVISARPGRR